MTDFDQFIRRGTTFNGRKLLGALRLAAKPPHVVSGLNGGLNLRGSGAETTIQNTRRQIIPKGVVIVPALVLASLSSATNRWEYDWQEADLDAAGEYTIFKVGGRRFDDTENGAFGKAKNTAEQRNTASIAVHGVDLTPPPGGSVAVLAIPNNTPVWLFRAKRTDGFFSYSFSEVNAINFTCAP